MPQPSNSAISATGHNSSISPLVVAVGIVCIDFLAQVFGAEEEEEAHGHPSGAFIQAQVRMEGTVLMLYEPQQGWPGA